MTPQKKPDPSFISMQILSSKAHKLWAKAKQKRTSQAAETSIKNVDLPEQETDTEYVIALSLSNVAKATLVILGIIIGLKALFILRNTLMILGLALFLSVVIDASVRFFERCRLPRSFSVLLVYFAALSLVVFLVVSLVPIVANQIQDLAYLIDRSADAFLGNPQIIIPFAPTTLNEHLSTLAQRLLETLEIQDRASALLQFGQSLSLAAKNSLGLAVQVAGSVVNFILSLILILFLTFFLQMEKEKIGNYVRIFFPRRMRSYIDNKSEAVYHKMAQWAQGQITLCCAIGIMVFIALTILGMPYALTLALLAGFTEFIPVAGPLIAAIPAVLIALTQGGFVWGVVIAGVYYVIQVSENNILVPIIMKHAVGLSPIVVILSMLVAVSFPDIIHPVLGVILAVPVTTIITIFLDDLYQLSRGK